MDEFSTYIFKENEIKTNNIRVNRERPYYIGILIFLLSVVLYLLDFDYAIHFGVIGYIVLVVGQITMSMGDECTSISTRDAAIARRDFDVVFAF